MNTNPCTASVPLIAALMVATIVGLSTAGAHEGHHDVAKAVDAIRAAAARYADVNVALAEGFIPDPSGHCVDAAMAGLPAEVGAMGIHYMNMARLGVTTDTPRVDGHGIHTDFREPAILLYEPQADGSLELVGVENLVFEKAWLAAGHDGPPKLVGRDWDHMADDPATQGDEAHGFEPHFDHHVWLRKNPAGDLMPFNPTVTCAHAHHTH
ncbi:hypothetical protein [Hoeflea marina]|nr:hypothetical protein [Hoeflea marina]